MTCCGLVRVTAASHRTHVADPLANAHEARVALERYTDSHVVLFAELSLSGYSCGDLFLQEALLAGCLEGLHIVVEASRLRPQVIVMGLPIRVAGKLYNAAAVVEQGQVLGVVPKQYLPNYQEFYEARWFAAATGQEPSQLSLPKLGTVPFGIDLLFEQGELSIGVEICEDLWMPVPPSSYQALAGANVLLNLSASNELIGKAAWRETLVRSQSGRCLAAYAYASAGPGESTTDLVFGGHCLIAENGAVLAQSERVGQGGRGWLTHSAATADIDLGRLAHDRQLTNSWQQASQRAQTCFRRIPLQHGYQGRWPTTDWQRPIAANPFVPASDHELHARCAEIFGIQCAALAKRVGRLPPNEPLNIGISGGLDSTLALLVAVKMCAHQGYPASRIAGVTMPGFGTTTRTLTAARELMKYLSISATEIDIRPLCLDTFRSLGHQPFGIDLDGLSLEELSHLFSQLPAEKRHDLVFENVQARVRTLLLMSRGFVLGTGDLSEQALGWSTYNGDHMSMYNVNASIPKTLVKFLVRYVAEHEFDGAIRQCLLGIVDTPISPELLPPNAHGQIEQLTEVSVGAYELHDFFLYHFIRHGMPPQKILRLAEAAQFSKTYSSQELRDTLRIFLRRFFHNQFKRSCVPDGPKVGSVSLSPRGDWRMPSDAEVNLWLSEL